MNTFHAKEGRSAFVLSPAWLALAVLAMTLLRLMPIGAPLVFSDEYSYASWTKFLLDGLGRPELAPALSNWLYLRVFEAAHFGRGDALAAARALNALCAAAAGGFVFLFARHWTGTATAAAVATAYGFFFVGGYAAYFMPEAMFFAGVALLMLPMHRYLLQPGLAAAVLLGITGALVTSVKSHGLLLLPAVLAGVVACHRADWRESFSRLVADCLAVIAAWWGATVLLSGVLGGEWSLNPLGGFYTDIASSSASNLGPDRFGQVVELAARHASAIMLVAGFPVVLALVFAVRSLWRAPTEPGERALASLAVTLLCGLGGMFLVSVLFTVSQAGAGPYETLTRLHGRYYEHLILLTAFIGVLAAPRLLPRLSLTARWILAAVSLVFVIAAAVGTRGFGWQGFNDFSVAYAIFAQPIWHYYAVFISIGVVVLATLAPRRSHTVLAAGLLVWLAINAYETEKVRYSLEPQVGDRSGELIAQAEAGGDRAGVLVLAQSLDAQVFRLAFKLLDENVHVKVGVPADSCPASADGTRWIVVAGGSDPECGAEEVANFQGMNVARLPLAPTAPPAK